MQLADAVCGQNKSNDMVTEDVHVPKHSCCMPLFCAAGGYLRGQESNFAPKKIKHILWIYM